MSKSKKKIINKLREGTVSSDELKKNTDDLVKTAKDSLDIDDEQAKDYVSGFIGEDEMLQGTSPEVGEDKYAEYEALKQKLAAEEGNTPQEVSEKGEQTEVIAKLRSVAESKTPSMTKDKLVETVVGKKPRKIIKTIKVKDIK